MKTNMANATGEETSSRINWELRYQSGNLPWDSGITPPEVQSFWQQERLSPTGRALDLGCGTATNVAYLARLGLHTVGVDLSGRALQMARHRMRHCPPDLKARMVLAQASAAALPLRDFGASYILDVGCFHTLPLPLRDGYVRGVVDNLAPGGYYHLYGFDWDDELAQTDGRAAGIREYEIIERYADDLQIVDIARAEANPRPCRWYLLRKSDQFSVVSQRARKIQRQY